MLDIESIKKEYDQILTQLADPELLSDWPASNAKPARQPDGSHDGGRSSAGWQKFEELSKKKARLEKIIAKAEELEGIRNQIEENKGIIKAQEDPALISLAETELKQFLEKTGPIEKELENLLKGDSGDQPGSVVIEIRAGAGGQEATLFAADLYRMYSKYAESRGWKHRTLDSQPTELGGFKQIIFELKGNDVWSKMQYEGGVHRVQRIPATEKLGRIHTSTISVAVLPKSKKTQIKITPQDLRIDTYRASGPGGQYVNRRETAIRITHLSTGLVVTSQNERSQLQNKENAMAILEVKLQELKEAQELEKMGEKRKSQIKQAKRADKIRTYNFPQDRVTDHRIQKSFHNLEQIMDGKLDQIIEPLSKTET